MAWERSGVPGGSTRTSWFDRDLPAMWHVLENQQSDDHWRLVAGWRKASELTATHLRRLEHYRSNLAEVWPPDRNTAAAAYVARLDFLIQNVRTTHEVAAANYSTLAATVGALSAARRDLKPLYDEYVARSRAVQEHADLAAFNAAAEAPAVIGAAPAAAQDLERLNNRARAIMYTLSHTLVEAEAAIRQPPTYQPQGVVQRGNPDVYGNGPGPTTRRRATERSAAMAPATEIPTSGRAISAPTDMLITTQTHTSDKDPGLTHTGAGPRTQASTRGFPLPSDVATGAAKDWRTPTPGDIKQYHGSISGKPHENQVTAPRRILPTGGVIEAPGYRVNSPGPTERLAGPTAFGGVIGGAAPRENSQRPSRYQPVASEPDQRLDPAYPWRVPEGGPTVIQPRNDATQIDPGPLIG